MAQSNSQSNAMLITTVLVVALVSFAGGYIVGQYSGDKLGKSDAALSAVGAGRAPSFGAVEGGDAPIARAGNMADSPKIPVADSYILGNPDAPITIVEFSDFQCPFCQRGGNTVKELQRKYPNDVRIVFKHNPLPFHNEADEASRAAMAAGEQGKFWEMHDKLFASYNTFKGADMKELTSKFAADLGMDVEKYKADYENEKFKKIVERDLKLGSTLGVRGTPHFFINGERVSGAQPLQAFEEIVKRQLDEARKATQSGTAANDLYKVMVDRNYKDAEAPKPQAPQAQPVQMVPVDINRDMVKGNAKDALITIVEFSEFQCPFCSRGDATIKQVVEKYGDDVRIVFKHLPLPFHDQAEPAARASLAAGKQGKFWEMHDILFKRQAELKGNAGIFPEIAASLGLNMEKWEKDFNSEEIKQQVKQDADLAGSIGARGTPNFFINGVQLVGAQPINAFEAIIDKQKTLAQQLKKDKGLSGEALYKAIVEENKKNAPAPAPTPAEPSDTVDDKLLAIDGSPFKGPENAPVTIYEFSDFQCPFCSRVNPTLQQLMEKYPKQVRIVFKHNPLPFHNEADEASRASIAAHKQGKFWEMHDLLFQENGNWKGQNMDELVVTYAEKLGLNVEKFKKDYNDPAAAQKLKDDMAMGTKAGVRGTPNFIVGTKRVVGAQALPAFEAAVEEMLKKK